jgi:type IV secretory pathway TrbF-like protein
MFGINEKNDEIESIAGYVECASLQPDATVPATTPKQTTRPKRAPKPKTSKPLSRTQAVQTRLSRAVSRVEPLSEPSDHIEATSAPESVCADTASSSNKKLFSPADESDSDTAFPAAYPDITKAGQRYLEQNGDPLVTNSYLKVALLVLCLIIALLAVALTKNAKALADVRPLIIRINDVGRADAIDYKNFSYKPQEAENKYYLTRWAQLYFQRNKFTIEKDQTDALFFVDSQTSRAAVEAERKTKYIAAYQTDSNLPYVEITVTNIVLSDLTHSPYSAQVEFLKIFKDPNGGGELRRERWTASVNYVFQQSVSNDMLAINPLGMTIINYRVDQAFDVQSTSTLPVPVQPIAHKMIQQPVQVQQPRSAR